MLYWFWKLSWIVHQESLFFLLGFMSLMRETFAQWKHLLPFTLFLVSWWSFIFGLTLKDGPTFYLSPSGLVGGVQISCFLQTNFIFQGLFWTLLAVFYHTIMWISINYSILNQVGSNMSQLSLNNLYTFWYFLYCFFCKF